MPNPITSIIFAAVRSAIPGVAGTANGTNIIQTHQFSQCSLESAGVTKENGGICEAVILKWIELERGNDEFWNWLLSAGQINLDRLRELLQIQKQYQASADDDNFTDGILNNAGIGFAVTSTSFRASQFRTSNNTPLRSGPERTSGKISGSARQFAEAIIANVGTSSDVIYKKISIYGPMGAHSMAARIQYANFSPVLFIDPNFGEFQLQSAVEFVQWFAEKFWKKSNYDKAVFNKFVVESYSA